MARKVYPIDDKRVVTLGGAQQHIRVRGTNPENPVLLFLHGGPGVSDRNWVLENQSGLAEVCTMVCWDQRGSGKSYNSTQAKQAMTIDMMVGDANDLVDYLCAEFSKDQIYIAGHSWGTVLGVLLAQQHPEHIAAYVGQGQVVNLEENERISYQFVWDEANRLNDKKAIRDLAKIGAPKNGSYGSLDNLIVQRNYMTKYGGAAYGHKESIWASVIIPILKSPEYNITDLVRFARGSFYCLGQLWDEVTERIRFDETVKEFSMPIYFTEGRHDQNTPPSIALPWYEGLKAPAKEWVWFEKSGHSPIKEEPELWGETVRKFLFDK